MKNPQSEILIGGDLRPSTDRIMTAVAFAINYTNYKCVSAGKIPTSVLVYYAQKHSMPCIMVTAHQAPVEYNGIHFYPLSDVNQWIDEDIFRQFEVEVL